MGLYPDPVRINQRFILIFSHKREQRVLENLSVEYLMVSLLVLRRCKLFYKKDNEFKEKGVGTLHLKPTANQKTQLLVRADTSLGGYLVSRVP